MAKKYEHPNRSLHEARVGHLVDRWVDLMAMEHIDIVNLFSDGLHGEEADTPEVTAAITTASWEYRKAEIHWYLPMVAAMSDEGLEEVVVHELCHVLLGPLKDHIKAGANKLEELATENAARAILRSAGVR